MSNLFHNVPARVPEELLETLVEGRHVRIERIVSTGHTSPPGFWYDQEEAEWVVVLRGEAHLQLEGENALLTMRPGDYVHLAAHQKHRVEWTSTSEPTVWLAVFYRSTEQEHPST